MMLMVDFGFFLIIFFMFMMIFSKLNMMKLSMFEKDEDNKKIFDIKEFNIIMILMGKDDRIFWY